MVPLTSTTRPFGSEVLIAAEPTTGPDRPPAAQCQHIRAVSPRRVHELRGNVGGLVLTQIRETIAVLLDVPA